MSNSPEIPETERLSRRRAGKTAPEKSTSFAQTCSLLSQFLKARCNLGDLSREMTGILESKGRVEAFRPAVATMNLLPKMDGPAGEADTGENGAVSSLGLRPLDFFPQSAGLRFSDLEDSSVNNNSDSGKFTKMEPESAQMTIFYAGKVMVYNDFPADKAKEVMALASKGSTQNPTPFVPMSSGPNITLNSSSSAAPKVVASTSPISSSVSPVAAQECLQPQHQAVGPADMPIARRKSLHRFLEKRKDRSATRAPYQVHKPLAEGSPKAEGSSSLADMEVQPSEQQLELKL